MTSPVSDVMVHGVGTSRFAKQPAEDVHQLAATAVLEALADADAAEVDAVWVGTVFGAPGVAQRALHAVGITGVPIITVENACASGTTAFHEAYQAVATGRHERVLALGVESMTTQFAGAIHPEMTDPEGARAWPCPACTPCRRRATSTSGSSRLSSWPRSP